MWGKINMVQSRGKEKMEITTQFWKGKKKLKQVKIFVCDLSHSFGKRLPSSVVFKASLCLSLSKNAFLTVIHISWTVSVDKHQHKIGSSKYSFE